MARKHQESAAPAAGVRAASVFRRAVRAFRTLPPERRIAAYASLGLFFTLFLPWYSRQFVVLLSGHLAPASDSQNGWQAFSFVEAAVLLVAVGVLVLLFQRAEGRAFHVPGGDGWVITAAGAWTCLLIVWRIFDRQGGTGNNQHFISWGIRWGIFIALAVAALLAYAGSRIRAAAAPEPPLPGEDDGPAPPAPEGPARRARAARATAARTTVKPGRAPTGAPAGAPPSTPAQSSGYVVRRRRPVDVSQVSSPDPPEFAYDRRATRPLHPRLQEGQDPKGADHGPGEDDDQLTIPFDSDE